MSGHIHYIGFESVEVAKAEYERIANLIRECEERTNDLPKTIELNGIESVTAPLDKITTVGFTDYALQNEHEHGVRDAFPNLFKR